VAELTSEFACVFRCGNMVIARRALDNKRLKFVDTADLRRFFISAKFRHLLKMTKNQYSQSTSEY